MDRLSPGTAGRLCTTGSCGPCSTLSGTPWHHPRASWRGHAGGMETCQLRPLPPSISQTLKQHVPRVVPKLGRQGWYVGLGLSGLWLQVDGGPPALKGATTPVVSL